MSRRRDSTLQLDRIDYEHSVFRQVLRAIIETATTATSVQESDYEELRGAIAGIVPEITTTADKLIPRGLARAEVSARDDSLFPVSRGQRKEDLAAAVRFFLPRWLDEGIRGIGQAVEQELLRLVYLGPLRSYPPRHLAFAQHHDPNWLSGGGYAWDVVRRDAHVRDQVNAWLSAPNRLQTPYEMVLRDLVAIEGLEVPLLSGLERLSEQGLDIEPDYDGDSTMPSGAYPVIKDPEAEAVELRDVIRSSDIEKLAELVMVDRRSNTIVSHRDVGIGISQVLPVLVVAYASSGKLIAMEQPEIHLHPALQAELGDVFIVSALGAQKNTFILETHSEHLILRIMHRLRDTYNKALPEGVPALEPDLISILYVEPTPAGAIIREMPLNERGELVKAWPGGFFEEGLREVLP